MSWMAYAAIGFALASVGCFAKGAFAFSWDGLPWMFWCAVSFVAALVFGVCAIFA